MNRTDQHGPDGSAIGKGATAALLVCGIFITVGLFAPALLLPQIQREFSSVEHAPLLTQLIGGIACFFFAVGSPLAGLLIARIGCRAVILPSLLLFGIAGLAPAFLDNLWLIVATRAGVGLATAGVFTGALSGIGQAREAQRHRLFGFLSFAGGVAALILFPMVGELAKQSWRMGFWVYMVAGLALPMTLLIPSQLGRIRAQAGAISDAATLPFFNKSLVGLLVIAALIGIAIFVGGLYAPLYLATSLGITDTRLLAIPSTLGSALSPVAAALYGPIYRRAGLNGVTMIGLVGLAIAFLVAAVAGDLIVFSGAMTISGVMFGLLSPHVSASALAFSAPERASSVIGLANGVLFGSQLLAPFAIAAVRSVGAPASVFVAMSFTAAIAFLLVALLGRNRGAANVLLGERTSAAI